MFCLAVPQSLLYQMFYSFRLVVMKMKGEGSMSELRVDDEVERR
jgi:hypothetical protein